MRHCAVAAVLVTLGCGAAGAQEPPRGAYAVRATPAEVLGAERAAGVAAVVPADEQVEWEVYVPPGDDALSPPGLLVFVSPSDSGRLPTGWATVLDRLNLIWVAANAAGNEVSVARRALYAVLGAGLAADRHETDAARTYIAGFSGGAGVASLLAAAYPGVFRGGLYIGGGVWEGAPSPGRLDLMRRQRYVFMAGADDFARGRTAALRANYRDAGITATESIVMRRTGHALPEPRYLLDAIRFLDGAAE